MLTSVRRAAQDEAQTLSACAARGHPVPCGVSALWTGDGARAVSSAARSTGKARSLVDEGYADAEHPPLRLRDERRSALLGAGRAIRVGLACVAAQAVHAPVLQNVPNGVRGFARRA